MASGSSSGGNAVAQGDFLAQHLHQRRNVARALAQRRHAHGQHMQAVEQVSRKRPSRTSADRSREVAAITRTSKGTSWLEPSGSISPSCSAQQLGLQAGGMSPISSRNSDAAVGQLELAVTPLAVGPRRRRGHARTRPPARCRARRQCSRPQRAAGTLRGGVDGMGQQFLAGARFAQQQHRAGRLRRAPRLALDLGGRRAGADETGEGVFGAPVTPSPPAQLLAALRRQFAARFVQVALQQRELLMSGCRWSRVVKQHNADGTDDLPTSSRNGMRLTTKVPALLVSRSMSTACLSPARGAYRCWGSPPPCAPQLVHRSDAQVREKTLASPRSPKQCDRADPPETCPG